MKNLAEEHFFIQIEPFHIKSQIKSHHFGFKSNSFFFEKI